MRACRRVGRQHAHEDRLYRESQQLVQQGNLRLGTCRMSGFVVSISQFLHHESLGPFGVCGIQTHP